MFWIIQYKITVNTVSVLFHIGRIIVTLSMWLYWKSLTHFDFHNITLFKHLFKTSLPLFGVSLSAIIITNTDVIILGWLFDTKEVRFYTVAANCFIKHIFLQITGSAIAPKLATLSGKSLLKEMEKMIKQVTKGLSIIGLIPFVIFFVLWKKITRNLGSKFMNAYWILVILSIGQIVNLGTGAVGLILIMTGNEKVQSKLSIIFAILIIILNIILIKFWNAIGAAVATSLIITASNIFKVYFVKKIIGINTLPFKLI